MVMLRDWLASRVISYFGMGSAPPKAQRLALIVGVMKPVTAAVDMISSTFFVIFVAERLSPTGNYWDGLGLIAVLVGIRMLVQVAMDYPTGALGDWIGQRWVLAAAWVCYAASYMLASLAADLMTFLLVYIINAVAMAQQSGALASWFDSNYRAVGEDPKRERYTVFLGRASLVSQLASALSIFPGALAAVLWSRSFVLLVQGALCLVLAVLFLVLIRDYPEMALVRHGRSLRAYGSLLLQGLRFFVSSKMVFLFVLGVAIVESAVWAWGSLILYPLYYGYLITDERVGILRTVIYVAGMIASERAGVWTSGKRPAKWIVPLMVFQLCGPIFYLVIALIIIIFPYVGAVQILPTALIAAICSVTYFLLSSANILKSRLYLDLVPSRIRNAFYSFIPTITMLLSVPLIMWLGHVTVVAGAPLMLFIVAMVSGCGIILVSAGLRQETVTKI